MKATKSKKIQSRKRRHARVRACVSGTSDRPRLCVFRSNKYIYAQLIDDEKSVTLTQASDISMKDGVKTDRARKIGVLLAEGAKAKKITKAVFDRGGFRFAGRVKALAEGAREAGLKF